MSCESCGCKWEGNCPEPESVAVAPQDERDVHTEHCCHRHGCKYASEYCPVVRGTKKQSYPCERCEDEPEHGLLDSLGIPVTEPDGMGGSVFLTLESRIKLLAERRPEPSSPSVAQVPRSELVLRLSQHWLTEVVCDHEKRTDQALCFCGWRSEVYYTVGNAVVSWAEHVAEKIGKHAFGPIDEEAQRKFRELMNAEGEP